MELALVPSFFFFNDTATTEIYTLSLHDALPIYLRDEREQVTLVGGDPCAVREDCRDLRAPGGLRARALDCFQKARSRVLLRVEGDCGRGERRVLVNRGRRGLQLARHVAENDLGLAYLYATAVRERDD